MGILGVLAVTFQSSPYGPVRIHGRQTPDSDKTQAIWRADPATFGSAALEGTHRSKLSRPSDRSLSGIFWLLAPPPFQVSPHVQPVYSRTLLFFFRIPSLCCGLCTPPPLLPSMNPLPHGASYRRWELLLRFRWSKLTLLR